MNTESDAPAPELAGEPTTWQPFIPGMSGILGADPRHNNVDPFEHDAPPADRGDGIHVLTFRVFRDHAELLPALDRGQARFAEHLDAVRQAITASDEHAAYVTAAERITAAGKQAARLRPRVAQAEASRDELLTADDDAKYQRLDAEASGLRARLDRLDEERRRLQAQLPALEMVLTSRANALAMQLSISAQDELAPEILSLCGLLNGEADALDRVIELDTFRGLLRSLGGHQAARQIVVEIVQEHAAAAEQAGPQPVPVKAWCGIQAGTPPQQALFVGSVE